MPLRPAHSVDELEEFKALLGPLVAEYTEPQLRQLRVEMRAMAEILLDFYLLKIKKLEQAAIFDKRTR